MTYRVLCTARSFGKVSRGPLEWLESQGCEAVFNDLPKPMNAADLAQAIRGMDAAIIGNDQLTAPVFAQADRLKVVSMHGVGVNHIDLQAAARAGVVICNTPGANREAVAELAVGLIFCLARQIVLAHASTQAGGWERFTGFEVTGKTVGVIGLGAIGRGVARRMRALGCRVLAYDVMLDEGFLAEQEIACPGLEPLLRESDFVSLHVPLTEETRHLLSRERLALMKTSACLINTSRGEIVNEQALADALNSGALGGAGLDVYVNQPPVGSPLLTAKNCVTLPHIGAYSHEALERMGQMAAANVVAVLTGGIPHHPVRAS